MLASALLLAALAAEPSSDRVLLCRPAVAGDPALARADALLEAARALGDRLLDYGVPCESPGEAARAARRAGLAHALTAAAEGGSDGSVHEMAVVDADGRTLAIRKVIAPPGGDLRRSLEASLEALLDGVPRPAAERTRRRGALAIAGGGLALVAGGLALAAVARGEADRANGAATPLEFLEARHAWGRSRAWSGVALGLGGAALAAGIAWRVQLPGGTP
jgi:hypothetical protein